jgi:hypothetical protein
LCNSPQPRPRPRYQIMAYLMLVLLAAARYICADLSGRSQVRIPHFVLDILTPDREAMV